MLTEQVVQQWSEILSSSSIHTHCRHRNMGATSSSLLDEEVFAAAQRQQQQRPRGQMCSDQDMINLAKVYALGKFYETDMAELPAETRQLVAEVDRVISKSQKGTFNVFFTHWIGKLCDGTENVLRELTETLIQKRCLGILTKDERTKLNARIDALEAASVKTSQAQRAEEQRQEQTIRAKIWGAVDTKSSLEQFAKDVNSLRTPLCKALEEQYPGLKVAATPPAAALSIPDNDQLPCDEDVRDYVQELRLKLKRKKISGLSDIESKVLEMANTYLQSRVKGSTRTAVTSDICKDIKDKQTLQDAKDIKHGQCENQLQECKDRAVVGEREALRRGVERAYQTRAFVSSAPPSPPRPVTTTPPPQFLPPPNADDWRIAVDPSSGHQYWWNPQTQETRWLVE